MTGTEQSHVDEETREQGTGERERASLATADDKGQRALQRIDSERERERERERECGSASSLKALHWIAGKKKKTKKGVDNKEVKNITGVENGMGTLGRIVYSLGVALRETGQALDRLGSRVQGSAAFKEECKHHLCTAVVYMEVEIDLFLFLPLFCLSRLPAEFRGDENPQAGRS